MEERELDFMEISISLKKRWKVIALTTIVITVITALVTLFLITPKYTSSTKLFIGKENAIGTNAKNNYDYSSNDIQMYQKILDTYADIIQTRTLISGVIDENDMNLESIDVLKNSDC